MTDRYRYEVTQDGTHPDDCWLVVADDTARGGARYTTLFMGLEAQARAQEYAQWKNGLGFSAPAAVPTGSVNVLAADIMASVHEHLTPDQQAVLRRRLGIVDGGGDGGGLTLLEVDARVAWLIAQHLNDEHATTE